MDKCVKLSGVISIVGMEVISAIMLPSDSIISVEDTGEFGCVANFPDGFFMEIAEDALFRGKGFWYLKKASGNIYPVYVKYQDKHIGMKKLRKILSQANRSVWRGAFVEVPENNDAYENALQMCKESQSGKLKISIEAKVTICSAAY